MFSFSDAHTCVFVDIVNIHLATDFSSRGRVALCAFEVHTYLQQLIPGMYIYIGGNGAR